MLRQSGMPRLATRALLIPALIAAGWLSCLSIAFADGPSAALKSVTSPTPAPVQREEARRELENLEKQAPQLAAKGKLVEAIAAGEKALRLARELDGPLSETAAAAQEKLAALYERREDWQAARRARGDVLAIRRKHHGDKDWRVVDARLSLADVEIRSRLTVDERRELLQADQENSRALALYRRGDFRRAIQFAEHIRDVRRRILGEKHHDYAESLDNLALFYHLQGDYSKPEPLYQQALEIRKKAQGETHPDYAQNLNNLAALYFAQGDYAKAEPLYRQALEIRKKAQGETHLDYAHTLNNLAFLYQSRGNYAKAEPLLRQALEIVKKAVGEAHPDYATSLDGLAYFLYLSHRDSAKAELLYGQALAIDRKTLGETHPHYATLLHNLAMLYESQGNYAKAEPLYRQALAIRKKAVGEAHPDYAAALFGLAFLYKSQADYAKAEPLYRQAMEIVRKALGEAHPNYAQCLNNLATLCESMGDYAKAELLQQQALQIYKKALGDSHPNTAKSLANLALVYQLMGDYAKAELLQLQALDIRKKVLGEDHPDTATSLNNLAALYNSMGDYAKAEPLYRQALEIYKRVLGDSHPSTAKCVGNLASLYRSMGDYTKAEPLYRQALEISKKALGEDHPDTATSLNNLAELYWSMGDYAHAEPLFRRTLEIRKKVLGEAHPDVAQSLDDLASLCYSLGDYAKSQPLCRQAIEIRKKVLGENHPLTAMSLRHLALLYKSTGDYAMAEPLSRQVLEIDKRALGGSHPNTAASLENLGELYRSMGDYTKAEPLCQQALEIKKKVLGENHPLTAQTLDILALLHQSMGHYAMAEPLSRQALEIYERDFANTSGSQSGAQQLAMADSLRFSLDEYLTIGLESGVSVASTYRHVLSWKGSVSFRQLSSRALRRQPNLKSRFDELQSVDVRIATLALRGPGKIRRDIWERQVTALSEQKESLERSLSAQSADFREHQALLNPKVEDLQRVLPEQAALIDFMEYWHRRPSLKRRGQLIWERRLAAFVVRHDRPVVRIELGPVQPLADAAESWRRAIVQDGGRADDVARTATGTTPKPPQQILKEAIWNPLQENLESAQIVLVSPDGFLNQVPLAALPGQSPGSYLVEEIKLGVVPVPRLLLRRDERRQDEPPKAGDQSLLIVGDVNYGGSPGKADGELVAGTRSAIRGNRARGLLFPQLDSTRTEMSAIRDSFEKEFPNGEVASLRGDEATESAFRREAPKYRWLHVATHGLFAPPEIASALAPSKEEMNGGFGQFGRKGIAGYHPGLLSGLALSGANTPGGENEDDGILTAVEVESMDLERAELVVLSACDTGLGRVAGGEGILGLQRAFQMAGAKTTVTSLWKVDDAATQVLMTEFYGNLWGIDPETKKPRPKLGKVGALRQAQLTILKHYDPGQKKLRGLDIPAEAANVPQRGSPYYWAAFVLSGDWR